ncbi:hypothetical protein HKX69_05715 [Streptomyces argyrophyllae]|uniref:Uncharacterized protein n=1 Tax=Streptomyces argyrophylli TaxID=2726118 RepID=A0A6M4PJG2_9ACTN|nr:hypothetical protein [Streptomyces argyrophyllae]QJS09080.1 hypothetical protein HKX69_05715 [Streptomyces argyrophyllae]
MTLEAHAEIISAAIRAAYEDGYELDDGDGGPIYVLELNEIDNGRMGAFTTIDVPPPSFT